MVVVASICLWLLVLKFSLHAASPIAPLQLCTRFLVPLHLSSIFGELLPLSLSAPSYSTPELQEVRRAGSRVTLLAPSRSRYPAA